MAAAARSADGGGGAPGPHAAGAAGGADGGAPGRRRAARALWIALVALALARAATAFAPSMWGWGFGVLRFVEPVPGWTLWALAALALLPPLSRRALPALAALGRAIERAPARAAAGAALLAAGLTWALPDRLRFVGDYLLRFGTAERALQPAALFPQALPLDVLLHYRIPRLLDQSLGMDVHTSARLLGALEAAWLAVLAVAFARALALRGATAAAAAAVALCGGYLGVFTGYGKAITEVSLLTAAVAVLGLRVIRTGSGLLPLGLCVAAGLALHRSALGLLPALAFCWWVALRTADARPRRSSPVTWAAAALPLIALAAMLPRMVGTFAAMDHVHFSPPEVERQGGLLRAMFAGVRPADLVNIVALISPLALTLPLVVAGAGRTASVVTSRAREGALLLLVALPWLGMILLVHPPQGIFRDWDNYAAAGVALALLTAWLSAIVLEDAPLWAWLGVPLALGALAPSVQWLAHNADVERGLARVEAYLREPPARPEEERAKTWDFLGIRYAQLGRWERSAAAMERAAALAPSPRVLLQWAMAEQARGHDRGAQTAYRRLVAVAPDEPRGWDGLARVAWRLGEWAECRRAARELLRLVPGDRQALEMLAQAERADSAARVDSAARANPRERGRAPRRRGTKGRSARTPGPARRGDAGPPPSRRARPPRRGRAGPLAGILGGECPSDGLIPAGRGAARP